MHNLCSKLGNAIQFTELVAVAYTEGEITEAELKITNQIQFGRTYFTGEAIDSRQ